MLNASDDAEYWDGLVIDYVVLGIRRAARRVAAEGTEREAEEEKKKKDEGGGGDGGDGGDGGGDDSDASSDASSPAVSIFCASRGVRPACRRARLCSRTFASRPTTIRIPTSIRIRAGKGASVGIPIPATVSTCLSWDVARRKTPRSNATLEWTLPALDALPPTRARAVMIAEPGGLVVTPALLARGADVRVVACDDAHLAEERRRVDRSPRGSDNVRVVVHASPRDAANALDAETVAVGGVDDDSGVYGSGSGARLPPPPALLMLVPAFDAGPLREAWRALASAWADARSRRTATAGASWR